MTQTSLPAARAAFTDQGGRPTPEFYRFLEALSVAQLGNLSAGDLDAINAQIAELRAEIDAIPAGEYPTLRITPPLTMQGLLQNGFALLGWNGTTTDVPEGTNLYYTDARADARIAAHDTLPCFLTDGTASYLHLASDLTIPCVLSDGTAASLPLAA